MFNGALENECGKCPGEDCFDNCKVVDCNAAFQSECVVAGETNVGNKIDALLQRLEQLENH